MKRVLTVAGTRPEAIKLAPVVSALRGDAELDAPLVSTGQHREILERTLADFGLQADEDLGILRSGQTLAGLTARALRSLEPVLERLRPDLVVVQGDTTTAFAAGLTAFSMRIPVAHVEAGLRTGDVSRPFPEEANRKLIATVADLHLAPTVRARRNLLGEGVARERIVVTGNTVVDALLQLLAARRLPSSPEARRALRASSRLVVVTTHRRESWGEPQAAVARAVARAAGSYADATYLVPLHPNPVVRRVLVPPLEGLANVVLCEPLEYGDMVRVLAAAHCVLTDSGGIQEEACALGVPVLVLRETTERPEAVDAGIARLVGTEEHRVLAELSSVLSDPRRRLRAGRSVFGDGRAAGRIHAAIRRRLGLTAPVLAEFSVSDEIEEDVA